MVWLQVDDIELIRNPEMLEAAIRRNSRYRDIDTSFLKYPMVIEPSGKKLRKLVKKGEHVVVLSFNSPDQSRVFRNMNNHPFLHLRLRNPHFPAKKIEVEAGVPTEVILSERLGFKMTEPKYGMESVAGAFRLKEYVDKIYYLAQSGMPVSMKALMFFGTAGSGKTHVAQAIAKKFGYKFGYLDLPHFMTLPSPTQALDALFDFLEEQNEKCVLLIDEIEKMFDFTGQDLKSKNVFGKLLTRLNDIYNDPDSNIIFIATANNITQIVANAPEFLRKGRFDEVFFLSYPDELSAKAVLQLFINKTEGDTKAVFKHLYTNGIRKTEAINRLFEAVDRGVITLDEMLGKVAISISADHLYSAINVVYTDEMKVSDAEEFIYSPPEISTVIRELQKEGIYRLLKQEVETLDIEEMAHAKSVNEILTENREAVIEEVVRSIAPLQIYAAEGIKKQIAQAENYTGRGDSSYSQYKKG